MSLDFVVYCQSRPLFEGSHTVGPIALSAPEPASADHEWALDQLPEEARTNPGSWVVTMNCRSSAGEHADYLGELIAERCGGGWIVCDHGEEALRVEPKSPAATSDILSEVTALLQSALTDAAAHEARQKAAAQREYEEAKKKDPAAFAKAEDWSDL